MFCNQCGTKVPANSSFCQNCGSPCSNGKVVQPNMQQSGYVSYKKPGNGLSIAGMVLGIIAISYAFLTIIALSSNEFKTDMIIYSNNHVAYGFGMILIQSVLSLVGLPLSISGMIKCKSGKNITGIILTSLTLVISIFIFMYVANY